jgi:hypothetical protein
MVRACHKCKEYVVINPADPYNQRIIKKFELNHARHAVVSVSVSEVKGYYENVGKKLSEEI